MNSLKMQSSGSTEISQAMEKIKSDINSIKTEDIDNVSSDDVKNI